jgi:hypothetical protein
MGNGIKWVMVVGSVLSVLSLGGCGDDDDGGDNGAQAGRDAGAVAGSGGAGGSGVTPLPADTAGKPCTNNGECGPGTCATQVEGLDGEPTMAPGGYCMGNCMSNTDCGTGGTCVRAGMNQAGLCYDGCSADGDCREGYLCGPITSTCRPAPPTDQLGDNVAGTMCGADTDCGDGICLTMRGMGGNATPLPGGYCSGACLADGHCGAGGICRRTGAGAGRCYESCATDPDCTRDGYRCRNLGDDMLGCLPAPDPLPDAVAGSACATDAECAGVMGACASELPAAGGGSVATPGGYCTAACEVNLDCGSTGAVCVQTRGGARCFKTCATMADCREGYVCGERGGGDMPSIVCTPFEPDEPDAG